MSCFRAGGRGVRVPFEATRQPEDLILESRVEGAVMNIWDASSLARQSDHRHTFDQHVRVQAVASAIVAVQAFVFASLGQT